jgi:hypothetical protein
MAATFSPAFAYTFKDAIASGSNKVYGPLPWGMTFTGCYIFAGATNAKTKVEVGTYANGVFTATGTIADGINGAGGAITTKQSWVVVAEVFTSVSAGNYIRVSAVEQANSSVILLGVTSQSVIEAVDTV